MTVLLRILAACWTLFAVGVLACPAAHAQDLTKIRFTLDWKIQVFTPGIIWRAIRVISGPRVLMSQSTKAMARRLRSRG